MLAPGLEREEWREEDGLGGHAVGSVDGIRRRRDHGLLVTATDADRFLLLAGFEAWVETPLGKFAISTHHYAPGVHHPDGARRLSGFTRDPWPRWRFALEDGTQIEQELFMRAGTSLVAVSWNMRGPRSDAVLTVRPFLAPRRLEALHYENAAFRFDPEIVDGRLVWRPYPGAPGLVVDNDGAYSHHPLWYRRFLLCDDVEDGGPATEDLASPGVFRFAFARGEAIWIAAAEGRAGDELTAGTSAEVCLAALRDAERARRRRAAAQLTSR